MEVALMADSQDDCAALTVAVFVCALIYGIFLK
jgi:hypothetical protein